MFQNKLSHSIPIFIVIISVFLLVSNDLEATNVAVGFSFHGLDADTSYELDLLDGLYGSQYDADNPRFVRLTLYWNLVIPTDPGDPLRDVDEMRLLRLRIKEGRNVNNYNRGVEV